MSKDVEFVKGLYVDHPSEKAPDFIKMRLSITRRELGNWLRGREEQYINVDIKESKNGKLYAAVNDFVPDKSKNEKQSDSVSNEGGNEKQDWEDDGGDSLPF